MAGPEDEADDFMADELSFWRFDDEERYGNPWNTEDLDELLDGDEDRLAEARDEIRRSTR